MDGKLLLAIIITLLINIILLLFILSIPVFTFIMYRKMRKKMSSDNKGVLGIMLIIINLFILVGAYFFLFKGMFKMFFDLLHF